jgi:hypothetical protein
MEAEQEVRNKMNLLWAGCFANREPLADIHAVGCSGEMDQGATGGNGFSEQLAQRRGSDFPKRERTAQ